jgi:hypothetical protein
VNAYGTVAGQGREYLLNADLEPGGIGGIWEDIFNQYLSKVRLNGHAGWDSEDAEMTVENGRQ